MTKKSDDDKGMLNEVLPDPAQAKEERRGSPRERTSQHLQRVLAAAAGLALTLQGVPGHADVTPPQKGQPDGGKKPGDKDAKPGNPPKPEPPGYGVVDPMPEPYIDRSVGAPGFLKLTTTPAGASILIDGKDTGSKTPQKKIKLTPGIHAVTVTSADKAVSENFTVEIKSGATVTEARDLKPKKKPAPEK